MLTRTHRTFIAAVASLGAVALAGAADAADGAYSPPTTLSAPDGSILHEPSVAIDSQDRATVVWSRYTSNETTRVESVQIEADGTVGPVRTLTESTAPAWSPRVAVDPEGRATVVWYGGFGPNRIQAVRVDADGLPGPVLNLSQPGAGVPQVVADSTGRATVVWYSGGGSSLSVQSAQIDADGVPGTVRTLSKPGEGGFLPRLAVDSHDRVTVVWSGAGYIQSVRIGSDGAVGDVLSLSDQGFGHGLPRVAIDAEDRATVVWQQDVPAAEQQHQGDSRRIKAVRIHADGLPGPVMTLSGPGEALSPSVAIDALGKMVVAWEDQLPGAVKYVEIDPDDSSGEERTLDPPLGSIGHAPEVAAGPCGTVITWNESSGSSLSPVGRVMAVSLDHGGAPTGPEVVSGLDAGAYHQTPSIVIGSCNHPILAWVRSNTMTSSIQLVVGATAPAHDEEPSVVTPSEPPAQTANPEVDPSGSVDQPIATTGIDSSPAQPPEGSIGRPHGATVAAGTLIVGRSGLARGHRLWLTARCEGRSTCRGVATAITRGHTGRVLARGRYAIASGSNGTTDLLLTKRGRRLLGSRRRPAATIVGPSLTTRTIWLRMRPGTQR